MGWSTFLYPSLVPRKTANWFPCLNPEPHALTTSSDVFMITDHSLLLCFVFTWSSGPFPCRQPGWRPKPSPRKAKNTRRPTAGEEHSHDRCDHLEAQLDALPRLAPGLEDRHAPRSDGARSDRARWSFFRVWLEVGFWEGVGRRRRCCNKKMTSTYINMVNKRFCNI